MTLAGLAARKEKLMRASSGVTNARKLLVDMAPDPRRTRIVDAWKTAIATYNERQEQYEAAGVTLTPIEIPERYI